MTSNRKDLLISIVNGNDKGYIYECVQSIIDHTEDLSYDIIVIDNCTGDQHLDRLRDMGAEVWINRQPMGFSANHAQVLDRVKDYRYLLIFNDDAFLLNNTFRIMLDDMACNPGTAISGCRIRDPDGSLQPTAAPFPGVRYFIRNILGLDKSAESTYSDFFTGYIDYNQTQDVDWVSGCCMAIDSTFIEEVGFLDTGYFMFLEDADLCRRAHNSGHRVRFVADAHVVHHRGGSSKGDSGRMKPKLFVETQRSRLRFLKKSSIAGYLVYVTFINAFMVAKLVRTSFQGDTAWARSVLQVMGGRPLV